MTVLCCASADGQFSKPFVIYPGVRPKYNLEGVNVDDYDLGNSSNGWITADCFFGWIANLFYPQIRDKVKFPVVLFLDGHSSHVSISVAQFCLEHEIILYCLPPHASHILQPLDVAVFGPMKKKWNKSLDDFKRLYRGLSMSRTHFFPVFDKCWKDSTSAENAKAGFRKCGLVPWDREAVAYDRIIDTVKNAPILAKTEKVSDQEKIGMLRMHQLMLNCIPPALMSVLVKRKEEGYDLADESALGTLWKIYKCSENLISGEKPSVQNASEVADDATVANQETSNSFNETSEIAQVRIEPDIGINPVTCSTILGDSGEAIPSTSTIILSEHDVVVDDNDEEENESINSSSLDKSYVNLPYSPFKNHKMISDDVIIKRKISINKTKVPFAISAREHVEHLQSKQNKKKRELEEKEKRKTDRQNKKKKKTAVAAAVETVEQEAGSEEIILDDSEDLTETEINICQACHGDEGWADNDLWLGCSGYGNKKCDKWFHKACLCEEVAQMDEAQLKEFELICDACKLQEKIANKKMRKN